MQIFHNFKKIKIFKFIFVALIITSFSFSFQTNVHALKGNNYTKQWIKNAEFNNSTDSWFSVIKGDNSDVNASIDSEQANFRILGKKETFSFVSNPPLDSNWTNVINPEYPNPPDEAIITPEGCFVSHQYDDQTAIQNPSTHWDINVCLPVNITDYIITSAKIRSVVYANASLNIDRAGDTEARNDHVGSMDTYGIGDFVRFYVLISDLEKEKVYEIAFLQPEDLGAGDPPGTDILPNTDMIGIPEENLIFYITSVLNKDFRNFTITLGIRLHFEDNIIDNWDYDKFNELIIKSVNLTFTYQKKINRDTEISWNQIGETIEGSNTEIINATLNFKSKINHFWPLTLPDNSELKISINNFEISKNVKINLLNTTFQEFLLGGFEVTSYILKDTNITLSIQFIIKDDFALDEQITISIDDVSLLISYTVFMRDSSQNYLIWIIFIVLLVIIGILSSLSLRSYVVLPRKQRKRNDLLLRTQKFKDAENIQGILLIHTTSGLPLFSKNYSDLMEGKNELFSGFIQAISLVGQEISLKKSIRSKGFRKEVVDGIYDIIELDFKHFFCLISDMEELRTVLILKNKASKRLKQQIMNFGLSVYAKFSETLKNWNNDLDPFNETIPELLHNYFALYYKDFFKLAIEISDLEKIKKEIKLSRNDLKVLNEIFKLSEENNCFSLITLLERLNDKNEDLIIDSIEILIKKNILYPITPLDTQY